MRIVVDTNVLVSGLLSPFGPPGSILGLIAAGRLILCHDARILAEYADVLHRPGFAFAEEDIGALLRQVEAGGELRPPCHCQFDCRTLTTSRSSKSPSPLAPTVWSPATFVTFPGAPGRTSGSSHRVTSSRRA